VLALVAAGCLTTGDVLVDRPWKLVEVAGAPPVDTDGVVGVTFGADGRFQVTTGCRSGGGTYHLDGNRILLDSEVLQSTSCDKAEAAQDAILIDVVEGRPRFEIDTRTGRLRLTSESGAILLFDTP
jgi:heat shock protein HslJ